MLKDAVVAQFNEHVDILLTMEIAIALARKDGRRIDLVVAAAWATIRPRVRFTANKHTWDYHLAQEVPAAGVATLRHQYNTIMGDS